VRAAHEHELRVRLRQAGVQPEQVLDAHRVQERHGAQVDHDVLERLVARGRHRIPQRGQRGDVELSLDIHPDIGTDALGAYP
jgi:hypothetical protein